MPAEKYKVILTSDEREKLRTLVNKGKSYPLEKAGEIKEETIF